jgi:type I restriction enzyme R subunit
MSSVICESDVELIALGWYKQLGYTVKYGPEIAPGGSETERSSYSEVFLKGRLREALLRLNSEVFPDAVDEVIRKLSIMDAPSLVSANRMFHRTLIDGIAVEQVAEGDTRRYVTVRLADFDNPDNNDWLVVNQFTVIEGQSNRRPDVVVFLNGIPISVIELKNPTDEDATIWTAFNKLQTYKNDIPSLFKYNEILGISDGMDARFGSLTSSEEWFHAWKTIDGEELASDDMIPLEVLIKGLFDRRRLLDYLKYFIVFEDNGATVIKKLAQYHQYHAVNRAVEETIRASGVDGDRRIGVIWHTQGSGKSLTMAVYAGKLILEPAMENPTIVVITDRNDLDNQLFGVFAACSDLLRQKPVQAESRAELRKLLEVASGGVVFTTIQKFFPEEKGDRYPLLSDRRNIVVMADEAHRSQYEFIDGFARNIRDALPNASFIGFTGTPIALKDRNTVAVFGDCISIYDIQQAVDDNATVPIYYEARLAKLNLPEDVQPTIDPEFEEVTEEAEQTEKERLKTKWAQLEAIVGAEKRVKLIAKDIVDHFEQRLEAINGKGMIVCMSRRICVDLYNELVRLRPDWHSDSDTEGFLKVVMTGSASDQYDWQKHIRNKERRDALAKRFKKPDDPFKLVIVRDMWLTGFDAPSLHTMYIDKPMQGHGLMQAIARVNRVFKDKPGGLIVDYLGLAEHLKRAVADYSTGGGKGKPIIDQDLALSTMLEKLEICRDLFHGHDYSLGVVGNKEERLKAIRSAANHILDPNKGADVQKRFIEAVKALTAAFCLAVPHPDALKVQDEVGFFQAVKATVSKSSAKTSRKEDLDHAVQQIVSRAIAADQIIDILSVAGLNKPDISILSDEFLEDVRKMPERNLALEALRRLLDDEIRTTTKKRVVAGRSFAEMLQKALIAYKNRSIQTAEMIDELIRLAKEMRKAANRGASLGVAEDELAFYEALELNGSAVQVLGDETLRTIAKDLVSQMRRSVTIDWTMRESVKAGLRTLVKRTLRKYNYPPDKREEATATVIEQAEYLSSSWLQQ